MIHRLLIHWLGQLWERACSRLPAMVASKPAPAFFAFLLVGGLFAFAGCQSTPAQPEVKPLIARFFLESRPGEVGATVQLPVSHVRINVNPQPVMAESDITTAEVTKVNLGWCLMFRFTPAATRDFYRMSAGAQGRRLVLTLNGQAVGACHPDQAVSNGGLLIFAELNDSDLPEVADRIRRTSETLAQHAKR